MKKPRCILPDKLYEVTLSTRQARFFFIPIPRLTLLIIGVLAYCQRRHGLGFCAVAFLSNHAHMLVRAKSADHARQFWAMGSIGDRVWFDTDGNGAQDGGEQGIKNVTLTCSTPA